MVGRHEDRPDQASSSGQHAGEFRGAVHEQLSRVETRENVQALLEAVIAIGTEVEFEQVQRRIVECAVELVEARRGALEVLGEEGAIRRSLTVGADTQAAGGAGLPSSSLSTPVRADGRVFANLHLTGKRTGGRFGAEDEALLRVLAAAAGVAVDHARLYEDAERRQRAQAESGKLTRSLLAGDDPAVVLHELAGVVCELAGADLVTLAVPVPDADELVIEAAAGPDAASVTGLRLPASTLAAKVARSGEVIASDHLSADARSLGGSAAVVDLGPAFFVPLRATDQVIGVLNVARTSGARPFDPGEQEMISGFAEQAALALRLAEHRQGAEQLAVFEERDRIARDLHDVAIQGLFAAGLSLQGVLGRITDQRAASRIQHVVDDLDTTIKTMRTSIYALHEHGGAPGGEDAALRARVLSEVDRAAEQLGFTPALRVTGPLETAVPGELGEHLIAVLCEMLSNTARHAHATAVQVSVEVDARYVHASVADDGLGIDPVTTRRSGLANLQARAERLGGSFTVTRNEPTGTIAHWSALLPGD